METKKGEYIKCNDCGKFGNAIHKSYLNEQIDCWEPATECPHCESEDVAIVITSKS